MLSFLSSFHFISSDIFVLRILVPDSMPLSCFLRLNACALLFLFLLCSSSISCLGNQWDKCHSDNKCGGFVIRYPFGIRGNGCGDPDFQIKCIEDNYPQLHIDGHNYKIVEPSSLGNIGGPYSIKIGIPRLCDLSGNYTTSWVDSPDSPFFPMPDGNTNLTFWKDCNQSIGYNEKKMNLCGHDWVYSLNPDGVLDGTPFCKGHLQLAINESRIESDLISNELFLQGEVLEITWSVDPSRNVICDNCLKSNGICGYNRSEPAEFLCYCPDGTSPPYICPGTGGRNKSGIIIGCSIGGVALTAIAIVLFLRIYAKKRKTPSRDLASGDMEAAVLHPHKTFNLPIFSYEELRQATNCFHEENEVGDGGFGSVYVGKIRDGRTVAVKRLYQDNSRRLQQFINEVEIFSTLKHPRVVRLYGCTSPESPELLLVYEFVANGTLADHLHGDRRGPKGLPWDTRLKIAIQTADALDFLHSVDPPIFHRDVKSSNILLDENFDVKVADFGLCRLVPVNASHVTTAPQGTPGYVDPEYHQCYQLTEKSDVYSFGVVLVEIISAKLAVDINRNRREINLANMAKSKIQEGALHELVDPELEIEVNHEVKVTVSAVAELAFRCLASERVDRPDMKEVVAQLEEIRQSWEASNGPGEQQSGSFSDIKQPLSPISVQDKWSSKSSTPIDTSA